MRKASALALFGLSRVGVPSPSSALARIDVARTNHQYSLRLARPSKRAYFWKARLNVSMSAAVTPAASITRLFRMIAGGW